MGGPPVCQFRTRTGRSSTAQSQPTQYYLLGFHSLKMNLIDLCGALMKITCPKSSKNRAFMGRSVNGDHAKPSNECVYHPLEQHCRLPDATHQTIRHTNALHRNSIQCLCLNGNATTPTTPQGARVGRAVSWCFSRYDCKSAQIVL
jgi:hypothetical protein